MLATPRSRVAGRSGAQMSSRREPVQHTPVAVRERRRPGWRSDHSVVVVPVLVGPLYRPEYAEVTDHESFLRCGACGWSVTAPSDQAAAVAARHERARA